MSVGRILVSGTPEGVYLRLLARLFSDSDSDGDGSDDGSGR